MNLSSVFVLCFGIKCTIVAGGVFETITQHCSKKAYHDRVVHFCTMFVRVSKLFNQQLAHPFFKYRVDYIRHLVIHYILFCQTLKEWMEPN